ncbi:hypothetical protein LINPERHAP1_LOCUS1826 [Linum perenne]
MHNPNAEHMELVTRILRYLKGTPGLGLLFHKHSTHGINVYTAGIFSRNRLGPKINSQNRLYVQSIPKIGWVLLTGHVYRQNK